MTRAVARPVLRVDHGRATSDPDLIAREAPLCVEIRAVSGGATHTAGILMRTPGDDEDLVRGWLYTERFVRRLEEIVEIATTHESEESEDSEEAGTGRVGAKVVATLAVSMALDKVLEHRSMTPTSACGLCGRVAIDRIDRVERIDAGATAAAHGGASALRWPSALIAGLPAVLLTAQTVFAATGGLHAAGLFDESGAIQFVREDIGRHNAVDKVVGAALAAGCLRDRCPILVVSGRVAFEIVQKAAVAGQMAVVAVGAPSDLAVDAARTAGLTLVGFARDGRFNVYAGAERIEASGVIHRRP